LALKWQKKLRDQLKADSTFLQRNGIIDYSLLLGIHKSESSDTTLRDTWIKENNEKLSDLYKVLRHKPPIFDSLSYDQFSHMAFKHSTMQNTTTNYGIYNGRISTFQRANGGMKSVRYVSGKKIVGEEIIFLGVIDILISYNTRKQTEHILKSVVSDSHGISVVPPNEYSPRFCNFMDTLIE